MLISVDVGQNPSIIIYFKGQTTGTYNVDTGDAYIGYGDENIQSYYAADFVPGTSGSIEVTSYGAVGELVVGTFDVKADIWNMVGNAPSGTQTTWQVVSL